MSLFANDAEMVYLSISDENIAAFQADLVPMIRGQSTECSKLSVSCFQQKIGADNFLCSLGAFQSVTGRMKTILGRNTCPMGCWAQPNSLVLAEEGQVKGDLVLRQVLRVARDPPGHTGPVFEAQCLWTCFHLMPLRLSEILWDGERERFSL